MGIESVWQKFDVLSDFIFSRSDYMYPLKPDESVQSIANVIRWNH